MSALTVRGRLRYAAMDLDRCITEWKDEKFTHAGSHRTQEAYDFHIDRFRALLQAQGLDLDSPAALIAPLARRYCAASAHREEVSANTFNQRRSILSSFYRFAVQHEVLPINPMDRVKSRKRDKPHAARPLSLEQAREAITRIDTSTQEGRRDKALLAIALTTGRRASELAALCLSHLSLSGGRISVTWVHMKGNEHETQGLDEKTSQALFAYLDALYGSRETWLLRMQEAPDTPLWLSFSRNPAYYGKHIGTRAIERLCKKHLGTSKAHTLRHTFAVRMHKRGATLAEIGRALHHKSLKTTSEYMEEQLEYENPYAAELAADFGI